MLAPLTALLLAASPSSPTAVVKRGNDEIQRVLAAGDASVDHLAKKADDFVDFGELAKRALGKEWAKLNKKQQQEFSSTMKGLLRASYAQRAISDGHGGADIRYGAEKVQGDEAEVPTTLVVKNDHFPVVYMLFRGGMTSDWRIYDVVTDDVSLMATYRDQFRQLIAQKGYEGLLATLKRKKEQLEKSSATR